MSIRLPTACEHTSQISFSTASVSLSKLDPLTKIFQNLNHYYFYPPVTEDTIRDVTGFEGIALKKKQNPRKWEMAYSHEKLPRRKYKANHQFAKKIVRLDHHDSDAKQLTYFSAITHLLNNNFKKMKKEKSFSYPALFTGKIIRITHHENERIKKFRLEFFANGEIFFSASKIESSGASKTLCMAEEIEAKTKCARLEVGHLKLKDKTSSDINENEINFLIALQKANFFGIPKVLNILVSYENKLLTHMLIYTEAYDKDFSCLIKEVKKNHYYFPIHEKFVLIHQVLKVLDYFDKNNLVHRDIKPKNILVKDVKYENGVVSCQNAKIALCDLAYTCLEGTAEVVRGTPLYIDPKVILQNAAISFPNCADDIWSFGIFMWGCLLNERDYPTINIFELDETRQLSCVENYEEILDETYEKLKTINNPLSNFFVKIFTYDIQERAKAEDLMQLLDQIAKNYTENALKEYLDEISITFYATSNDNGQPLAEFLHKNNSQTVSL